MGSVILFFGVALLVVAWRAQDKATRYFMLAAALLNLLSFAHMLATGHEHTWKLAPPSEEAEDPAWRR
jgi:hypothetical protein